MFVTVVRLGAIRRTLCQGRQSNHSVLLDHRRFAFGKPYQKSFVESATTYIVIKLLGENQLLFAIKNRIPSVAQRRRDPVRSIHRFTFDFTRPFPRRIPFSFRKNRNVSAVVGRPRTVQAIDGRQWGVQEPIL